MQRNEECDHLTFERNERLTTLFSYFKPQFSFNFAYIHEDIPWCAPPHTGIYICTSKFSCVLSMQDYTCKHVKHICCIVSYISFPGAVHTSKVNNTKKKAFVLILKLRIKTRQRGFALSQMLGLFVTAPCSRINTFWHYL